MRRAVRWLALLLALSAPVVRAGELEPFRDVREIGTIEKAAREGASLGNVVIHGLDFQRTPILWQRIDVRGAVFLGCKFSGVEESRLVGRGALVFPAFRDLAYDPYRASLYTPAELFTRRGEENGRNLDRRIYDAFAKRGRCGPNVVDALAQSLHDQAIDRALGEYLDVDGPGTPRRNVVAIMGGHSTRRDDPCFRQVALLAWSLARQGYLISTGGGPGMMEAGNLGAYLADYGRADVLSAVAALAKAPEGKSPAYYDRANEVLRKYPKGRDSLAVPTWFWGDEPDNLFGLHIAKYFSNAIREERLLATATAGVVFAPGSAGTTRELFQTAEQNHYGELGYYRPMVLLGKKRYAEDTKIYALLKELAKGREYEKFLAISDDPDELAEFIRSHPPKKAQPQ
jgi:predicted Rossmann-fold nucleotide-binding protein